MIAQGGAKIGSREFDPKGAAVEAVIKRLMTRRGECADGMHRGLIKAAEFLVEKAKEVVPVDTGALKATGRVETDGQGFSTTATVVFGDDTYITMARPHGVYYAVYVHEMTWLNHAPGKMAKYISIPAKLYREEMVNIIRAEAQRRS